MTEIAQGKPGSTPLAPDKRKPNSERTKALSEISVPTNQSILHRHQPDDQLNFSEIVMKYIFCFPVRVAHSHANWAQKSQSLGTTVQNRLKRSQAPRLSRKEESVECPKLCRQAVGVEQGETKLLKLLYSVIRASSQLLESFHRLLNSEEESAGYFSTRLNDPFYSVVPKLSTSTCSLSLSPNSETPCTNAQPDKILHYSRTLRRGKLPNREGTRGK